jgi:GT2 family glycosyltransferase
VADSVVIGYCHPGSVRAEFCASLLSAAMEGSTPLETVLTYYSGPNISTARNKICADFLTRPAPWLLMCDTDMAFAADAADRLIAVADPAERPLVGALCFSQNGDADPLPTMYDLMRKDSGELAFTRPSSWPEDTCVKVSATGAAFLLIHRTALEKIRDHGNDIAAPWFRESAIPGAPLALMGEDMTFCLRAGAAGIPVHVHTGVQVGHIKPAMLGKVT